MKLVVLSQLLIDIASNSREIYVACCSQYSLLAAPSFIIHVAGTLSPIRSPIVHCWCTRALLIFAR